MEPAMVEFFLLRGLVGRIQPVHALMPGSGEVSDIASAALFLASDESSFISGQILAVDGGWTAF